MASTAIQAISKIADPSIIPALEEAIRRRTEKFPDDYRNDVEDKLPIYLTQLADQIRERYAEEQQAEPSDPEDEAEPAVEQTPTEQGDAEDAGEPAGDSPVDESTRGGWGLWALGGALVLGAAAYAIAKGRSTG